MNEERKPFNGLTEEELDKLVDKVRDRAMTQIYADIGKSILRKLLWFIGAVGAGLWMWLTRNDSLPLK